MAGDDDGNGKLLARIDERTQRMDEKMDRHHATVCKQLDDHEDRIRGLEGANRQGIFRDVGTIIAAAFMALIAWLTGKPQ